MFVNVVNTHAAVHDLLHPDLAIDLQVSPSLVAWFHSKIQIAVLHNDLSCDMMRRLPVCMSKLSVCT